VRTNGSLLHSFSDQCIAFLILLYIKYVNMYKLSRISLNGNSGDVIDGKEPLSPPILAGDLGTFMGWVDEKRRLQVQALDRKKKKALYIPRKNSLYLEKSLVYLCKRAPHIKMQNSPTCHTKNTRESATKSHVECHTCCIPAKRKAVPGTRDTYTMEPRHTWLNRYTRTRYTHALHIHQS